MKNKKATVNIVYIIEYNGKIDCNGYSTLEKAINYLMRCGYDRKFGLIFSNKDNNIAEIKNVEIN